ncbi:MAG: AbrB/MazE/SpoVT family DNA-binding domain-containing protein [Thermoprotei archaeon]
MAILLVRVKIKVGPKGQIVIPKIFREYYGIKEGGYVILEPEEDKLIIRSVEEPREIVEWISKRRKRIKCREARLGELAEIDLEEFDQ